jgi:hypothetical protein
MHDPAQHTLAVAEPIIDLHERIRRFITQRYPTWHMIHIEERSTTRYNATLATRRNEHPDYILSETNATFYLTLTEDGPLETLADNGVLVSHKKSRLHCVAHLVYNGSLYLEEKSREHVW